MGEPGSGADPRAAASAATRRPPPSSGRIGPGGGGLQRRRRLGLPGLGGHRHPGCRPGAVRHRRLAVAGPRGAGRLPGPGRRVGAPLRRGGHRRAGRPGLLGQRRLPLLPLQDLADGRPGAGRPPVGAGRAGPVGHRGPGRQPRRPRRPPTRPAGGRRAGRGVPPGDGRVHQGRRAGLVAAARPADLGQAGGGLPGLARSLRHPGDPGHPPLGGRGRVGTAGPRASASSGCATTATRPASRCRPRTWPRVVASAAGGQPGGARGPATAT